MNSDGSGDKNRPFAKALRKLNSDDALTIERQMDQIKYNLVKRKNKYCGLGQMSLEELMTKLSIFVYNNQDHFIERD